VCVCVCVGIRNHVCPWCVQEWGEDRKELPDWRPHVDTRRQGWTTCHRPTDISTQTPTHHWTPIFLNPKTIPNKIHQVSWHDNAIKRSNASVIGLFWHCSRSLSFSRIRTHTLIISNASVVGLFWHCSSRSLLFSRIRTHTLIIFTHAYTRKAVRTYKHIYMRSHMSYEDEDTRISHEEEDACHLHEEEDTCHLCTDKHLAPQRRRMHFTCT
jgi:hypothetical protein